jgi:hypothetical protein
LTARRCPMVPGGGIGEGSFKRRSRIATSCGPCRFLGIRCVRQGRSRPFPPSGGIRPDVHVGFGRHHSPPCPLSAAFTRLLRRQEPRRAGLTAASNAKTYDQFSSSSDPACKAGPNTADAETAVNGRLASTRNRNGPQSPSRAVLLPNAFPVCQRIRRKALHTHNFFLSRLERKRTQSSPHYASGLEQAPPAHLPHAGQKGSRWAAPVAGWEARRVCRAKASRARSAVTARPPPPLR